MVETKILRPSMKSIQEAGKILRNGGIVIYPTDTSYGIAADATNSKSIKKIFKIKKRVHTKGISIMVPDLKTMGKYGIVTNETGFLAKKFMPGPLTIIIKKKKTLPNILSKEGVGFRIASNKVAKTLLKDFKKPITATSANISGQLPLYKIKDVIETFDKKVELILNAGDLRYRKTSTIIDLTNKPKILRQGPIKGKRILRELDNFIRYRKNK